MRKMKNEILSQEAGLQQVPQSFKFQKKKKKTNAVVLKVNIGGVS